jgi:hypothetical protein
MVLIFKKKVSITCEFGLNNKMIYEDYFRSYPSPVSYLAMAGQGRAHHYLK